MARVTMTQAQLDALQRKYLDLNTKDFTLKEFEESARSTIGLDGAITVPWFGMTLVIEKDGYSHT